MCVVSLQVCSILQVCSSLWWPQVNVWYNLQSLSTISFETGSLTELDAH